MKGKKGKGPISMITGLITTLIMIGVVLAILQVSGVTSIEDSFKMAKDKAAHYAECIPAGDCGLIAVIDEVSDGKVTGGINLNLPPVGEGLDLNLTEIALTRDVEGYRGPAEGEPYVTDLGAIKKEAAQSMLENVEIVKDDSKDVGYLRKEWKHWSEVNGRSCWNTREAILSRDAVPGTIEYVDKQKRDTSNVDEACAIGNPIKDGNLVKVTTENSGEWIDPYSGEKFTDSSKLDIDHIIPLSKAARSGGQSWTEEQKEQFANDPDNLLTVSAKENRTKSDKGPGEYMPKSKDYHCQYAKSYTAIAYKYKLTINEEDSKALQKALKTCDI